MQISTIPLSRFQFLLSALHYQEQNEWVAWTSGSVEPARSVWKMQLRRTLLSELAKRSLIPKAWETAIVRAFFWIFVHS
jgi:hypothetical protein